MLGKASDTKLGFLPTLIGKKTKTTGSLTRRDNRSSSKSVVQGGNKAKKAGKR
jgi:hypothetical protein